MLAFPHLNYKSGSSVDVAVEAPDNYKLKIEALAQFKQMKVLAEKGNPIAQYRLAQAYSQNSASYLQWMNKAAEQGLTNALLDLSRLYAESGTDKGLQQAAGFLIKIFKSNDSFIKSEAKGLVERNHLLSTEMARQLKGTSLAKSPFIFFASEVRTLETDLPPAKISCP